MDSNKMGIPAEVSEFQKRMAGADDLLMVVSKSGESSLKKLGVSEPVVDEKPVGESYSADFLGNK